jgi:hypothetical protein
MLTNKRLSILSDTIIEGEKIASYGAVLDLDTMELSMTGRYINKESCKEYRDMVRSDQAAFEDYAYMVQDKMKEIAEA